MEKSRSNDLSRSKLKNLKPIIILILMVGSFFQDGITQIPNSVDTSYSRLLIKADSLRGLRFFEASSQIYRLVKSESEKYEQWNSWFLAVHGLTKIALKEKDYLNFPDSLIKYSSILPSEEATSFARINLFTGYLLSEGGRNARAISYYNKAIPIFKEQLDSTRYLSGIKNLSNAYAFLGDHHSALKITDNGLAFLDDDKRHSKYGDFLRNKAGYHFYLGNYEKAIQLYKEAIALGNQPTYNKLHLFQAYYYNGNFDEAEKLLDSFKNIHPYYDISLSRLRSQYYLVKGDTVNAITDQRKAVEQLSEKVSDRAYTKELAVLSKLLYESDSYKEAHNYARLAIANHYPEVSAEVPLSFPPIEGDPEIHIIEASYVLAKIHSLQYAETKSESDQRTAKFYFDFMFQMFDNLKSNIQTNNSKYRLGAYSQKMYQDAIDFYLNDFSNSQDQNSYYKAFTISQLANSYVLRNTISERKALGYAQVPSDTLNTYLSLQNSLAQAYNSDETQLLDSLMVPYIELRDRLKEEHPGYNAYSSEELISVEELQKNLEKDELLIKYYYHDSKLTIFTIGKILKGYQSIKLTQENIDDINFLNELILKSAGSYSQEDEEKFTKVSKRIYDFLLRPLEDNQEFLEINQLYIIPDGPIKTISFNALMHREANSWSDFRNYLIDKYDINYLYYAGQLRKPFDTSSKDGFIGFGIKYEDNFLKQVMEEYFQTDTLFTDGSRSASLSVLNNAIDEVMTCAELLGGKSILEESVTRSTILDNLGTAQIAHFAVHALVDKVDFMNSYILLNKDQDDRFDLNYKDILNLKSNPDLVVLSACQTGIGQNIQGEGLMSLARAFVQGGSKASMGSYWNAPDKATMQLMKLFYRNLSKGLSKSESLRTAQQEYLTNDDISSPAVRAPYYWAGWTIYGNNDPINLKKKIGSPVLLFCGGIILLLIIALGIKRKKLAA